MRTPLRILIVDDHEHVRRGIKTLLSSHPEWEVCGEAVDGRDSLEKAESLRPDLVLMDISLPQMDGLQATRIIRRTIPDVKVIIVTQNDPQIARQQAIGVGAHGFVSKITMAQDLPLQIQNVTADQPTVLNDSKVQTKTQSPNRDLFEGTSDMAALMRDFDWSATPLGPTESWSTALRMIVRFMLPNPFPQLLWWGPDLCCLYNDSYVPVLGTKHPWALGRPVAEVWHEVWHVLQPLVDAPFHGGPATWVEDIPLEVNRSGFVEETHFTIAYSPIVDDAVPSGIGGVLATVHEISQKVVGERRVLALKDLGTRSSESKSAEDACRIAAQVLERHTKDVPFALLYLIDEKQSHAYFAAGTGINPEDSVFPRTLSLAESDSPKAWPFAEAVKTEEIQPVGDLPSKFESVPLGPWTDPPSLAAVVPIRSNVPHQLAAFAVVGISSRLPFDEGYRNFLDLVSAQISISIANARAYEEERKRAEALAEIDRAKTVFFSNVSHEFRTPLTLMLGPLQDLLSRSKTHLSATAKEQLDLVSRNGARLLRLVNTLLDFSRIEAGRVRAVYEATDLAAFTADLASVFRAATDKAGLKLVVDCPSLSKPVYVDRDMWEKIVLNLISNAFKFTFKGEIAVSIRQVGSSAELRVQDTGVGIPSEEMPKLFERFHRVPNVQGRSYEGTGIGLALVQELVNLHGGEIRAESVLGRGSTFIVAVPFGQDHLRSGQVGGSRQSASTAVGAKPFVEEALRWLPESGETRNNELSLSDDLIPTQARFSEDVSQLQRGDGNALRPHVVVADDNKDMRHYLARLLAEDCDVKTVEDGSAALAAIRKRRPNLVLADVMMPRLDGLGLLRELRADPSLKDTPVILLSARAGEESRVEGLHAGADDYLVKPFSARELLARVQSLLEITRFRQQARDDYRKLAESLETEVRTRTKELEERNVEVLRQSEQLRDLSLALLQTQDEERRNIARELHDSAGQTLAVLGLEVAELVLEAKREMPALSAETEKVQKTVEQLTGEIRTASYLLHPPLLDESGLASALDWYVQGLADRSDLKVSLTVSDDIGRFPGDLELVIFRLVQECLTNIIRHSGSKTASILINFDHDEVVVAVEDQGKGMPPERLEAIQSGGAGVGIRGMRERLRQFQGTLRVESGPWGTRVSVTIPITKGAKGLEACGTQA